MCIICNNDFNVNLTQLNCYGCKNIKDIPKILINLEFIDISYTNIYQIPIEFYKLKTIICNSSSIMNISDSFSNLEHLDCYKTNVLYISKYFIKLKYLNCGSNLILELPNTLINLEFLMCHNTQINILHKNFIKLKYLDCSNTFIKSIPSTYILLEQLFLYNTYISYIPKQFVLLKFVLKKNNTYWDKSWLFNINNLSKISKLQKFIRIKIKFPILWKIAEYYTQKKYSPDNILKYIDLDN